jgi:hypothetical protein
MDYAWKMLMLLITEILKGTQMTGMMLLILMNNNIFSQLMFQPKVEIFTFLSMDILLKLSHNLALHIQKLNQEQHLIILCHLYIFLFIEEILDWITLITKINFLDQLLFLKAILILTIFIM